MRTGSLTLRIEGGWCHIHFMKGMEISVNQLNVGTFIAPTSIPPSTSRQQT